MMTGLFRLAVLCLVGAAGAGASWGAPLAQDRKWDDYYDRAVILIDGAVQANTQPDSPQWEEAINLLKEAIALKPEPQTGRFGMIIGRRKAYFPYFYMGVAYFKSGQLEQAKQSFAQARQFEAVLEDKDLAPELPRYEAMILYQEAASALQRGQLKQALESFQQASDLRSLPPDLQSEASQRIQAIEQRIADTKRNFEQQVTTARVHLNADRYDLSIEALENARQIDPAAYEEQNLGELKRQAESSLVEQLLNEIRESQAQGLDDQVQTKLRQALAVAPGNPEVQRIVSETVGDYPTLREMADQALEEGDFAGAYGYLRQALIVFEAQARRDRLSRQLEEVSRKLLRENVGLLLTGKVGEAIGALRQAIDEGLRDVRAEAFLGVAYAKQALTSTDPARIEQLRQQALQHFRRARDLDPAYQLSARLVPPLILELFETLESSN